MKKFYIVMFFLTLGLGLVAKTTTSSHSEPQQESTTLLAVNSDDMEYVSSTTAWYWSGNYVTNWMSCDASIFRNKQDGRLWIKISKIGSYIKCPVEENPDYTGGVSGGKRTSKRYMASCEWPTHYFDID